MKRFNIRTNKPGAGNKEYIRKSSGGWSTCVKGSPTDKVCDVLANCVGYACGRFGEIINEVLGTTGLKYASLNCNAENFIERAKSLGLEIVDYPVLGGIMVMQKGATLSGNDGAGHVFIVEDIYDSNTIYTSESGYGSSAFWNSKRSNSNGRWGHGSAYSFRGCIVNPAIGKVTDRNKEEEPTPTVEWPKTHTVKYGDTLSEIALNYYGNGDKEHYMFIAEANNISDPNIISVGQVLTIPEYKETTREDTIKEGDVVLVNGAGNASSSGTSRNWTRKYKDQKMKVIMIADGRPYPYACNQYGEGTIGRASDVTGWFSKNSVRK